MTIVANGSAQTVKGKTMETNKVKEFIIRRDCFGNIYTQTELVRCKDCKFNDRCEMRDMMLNHENGYCADGELEEKSSQNNREQPW